MSSVTEESNMSGRTEFLQIALTLGLLSGAVRVAAQDVSAADNRG